MKLLTQKEYYTPPSEEVFNDIKQGAVKVWSTYDDTYKYASGKIDRIKDIQNVQDNYAYMVAMFDPNNQRKLLNELKTPEARDVVNSLIFTNLMG